VASYAQELGDQAKEIYNSNVWGWGAKWNVWRPPSFDQVMGVVKDWDDPDEPPPHGRTRDRYRRDLAKRVVGLLNEAKEIEKAVGELGFAQYGTGGGHEAYAFWVPDSGEGEEQHHFLLTNEEAHLPLLWDEEATLGFYEHAAEGSVDDTGGTMREVYQKLLDGTALPQWKKPAGVVPVGFDTQDVEVVNRHRQGLGMKPLDLTAGWTPAEIREMAERVRKTGRTNNPRQAELKRKLMR